MNPPRHRCHICKQEVVLVPTRSGETCPNCGAVFDGWTWTPPDSQPPHDIALTWLVLLAVLLTPPLATYLAVHSHHEHLGDRIAIVGSGVAAVMGAIWLVARSNLKTELRIAIGFLLAPVFYGACFVLCFAGCALGGGGRL